MPLTTILRDNREQKPYAFESYPVETEDVTLRTGDYSIADFCGRDEKNDTYIPRFAVERKSGPDFLNSISSERERFKSEIKRAKGWDTPMEVVIEEPWITFTHNINCMAKRNLTTAQVEGTVDQWMKYYNVNFHFAGNRLNAESYAFDTLMGWLRATITD